MGIILNGSKPSKIIYNGAEPSLYFNGSKIWPEAANLPPYTLRLRFKDGIIPTNYDGTLTQISTSPNVWDWTYNNPTWSNAWYYDETLLEVIDGNTSDVEDMSVMFRNCYALTSVSLFDTSNVWNMEEMFRYCRSLTTIPLFDTSRVNSVNYMFQECTNVESGALALYNQMSTQADPPHSHNQTFRNCGSDTVTGAAELAQIPSDWK